MPALKEYCNIYLYIKKNNGALFELIEDTCTEYLFKFKFITFLMPNTALLNKMKKAKPSEAAKMIKGLVLKGVYNSDKELSGEVYNIMNGKLKDSSKLKVKKDEKFVQWESYTNLSVMNYDGADVPAYVESEKKTKLPKKVIVDKKEDKKVKSKK